MGQQVRGKWRWVVVQGGAWAREKLGAVKKGLLKVKVKVTEEGYNVVGMPWARVQVAGWAEPNEDMDVWHWVPVRGHVELIYDVLQ